jgi:hypothetical protein
VEGHELSVLKGAVAIIAAHRPTILCEAEDRHKGSGAVATVLDFMADQNYNSYFFMKSKLRPVSEFDQTIHQRDIGGRFWNAADYCNSFLFTSRPIRADRTKVTLGQEQHEEARAHSHAEEPSDPIYFA